MEELSGVFNQNCSVRKFLKRGNARKKDGVFMKISQPEIFSDKEPFSGKSLILCLFS